MEVAIDRARAGGPLGRTLRSSFRWEAPRVHAVMRLGLPFACRIVLSGSVTTAFYVAYFRRKLAS